MTPASPSFGQTVTFIAHVTPGVALGEVSFLAGGVLVGVGPLNNGIAQLTTLILPAGAHSLRAVYGGSTGYQSSQSAVLPFTVTAVPAAAFEPAANAGAPLNPIFVSVGDFNRDGKADMAVLDRLGVGIFLGNGDGTFRAEVSYDVGIPGVLRAAATSLAVGDFNGDGQPDLVVTNNSGHIIMLLGNGNGTFQAKVIYSVGTSLRSAAVADFNLDGKVDLALVDGANAIILLGNGNGTFQAAANYSAGPQPVSVAVGDFNGDGQADLAVGGSNNVSVLLGNGNGTFQAALFYSEGWTPLSVAVGDFNGDGRSDIAAANFSGNNVSVLLGNGDGTFQAAVNYDAGVQPNSLAIGDFNGDGRADLAVANEGSNNVSVLFGNGSGSFQPAVSYVTRPNPQSLAVADFNGDGRADLAVVDWGVGTPSPGPDFYGDNVVLLGASSATANNTGAGVFRSGFFWVLDVDKSQQFNNPPDSAFAFGGIAGDIPITGDWNGDGHTKAGIFRPSNGLFILDSNGNGQFDAADAVIKVNTQAGDVPVVGDWNGDGRTKVGLFRQGFFWILYTLNGSIYKTGAFGGVPGDVPVVGDWNGDGISKIGVFRQGFLWILDYNGNGKVDNVNQAGGDQVFAFGGITGDVPVVGDWNGDGRSKVGVVRGGNFWVLDANGNHQFDGTGPGQDLVFPFGALIGDKPVVGK